MTWNGHPPGVKPNPLVHKFADTKDPYDNPKDALGAAKLPLHLVPASGIAYEAMAFLDGASKYDPYNWRGNKVVASIYIAACKRHLDLWFDALEEDAVDSGVPHLGAARACLGIIIDAKETGNLVDDRPPVGASAVLQERFKPLIARLRERWQRRLEKEKKDGAWLRGTKGVHSPSWAPRLAPRRSSSDPPVG